MFVFQLKIQQISLCFVNVRALRSNGDDTSNDDDTASDDNDRLTAFEPSIISIVEPNQSFGLLARPATTTTTLMMTTTTKITTSTTAQLRSTTNGKSCFCRCEVTKATTITTTITTNQSAINQLINQSKLLN